MWGGGKEGIVLLMVLIEYFANPPSQIRGYFQDDFKKKNHVDGPI